MRHCCKFKADDMYYLTDSNLYTSRILSIGFCPICQKPVAELVGWRFDGIYDVQKGIGIKANELMTKYKDEILYSMNEINYKKLKSRPYGWRYGINKSVKNGVRQYACDFYGNKELIKSLFV